MPAYKEIRVPCEGETWAHQSEYYIIEDGKLLLMSAGFAAVLKGYYANGSNFEKLYKMKATFDIGNACDGHDGWRHINDDWKQAVTNAADKFLKTARAYLAGIETKVEEL